MDNIIFRDKYVQYEQVSKVKLIDIHNCLINNGISLELNDGFINDWAGFAYWYFMKNNFTFGKSVDKRTISSFVHIITWFMTGVTIEIYDDFVSSKYYKNDKILDECLKIYNKLLNEYDSEIDICNNLINHIYHFYIDNHDKYIKKSEHMNCLLTFEDMDLFDKVEGKSNSDKLKTLLNNYYK